MKPEIIYLIAIELLMLVLIPLEVWFDKMCWAQKKSDKPGSTIIRGVFIGVIFMAVWTLTKDIDFASRCLWVMLATYLLLFDFWLNISRWKELPLPYYWVYSNAYKKYLGYYTQEKAHKMALISLTRKQTIIYQIKVFTSKFGYHGINPTSIYDRAFMRIPLHAEILLKGTVYGITLWWLLEF